MSPDVPQVPQGSGQHPIPLVVLAAGQLAASTSFYSKLLGVSAMPLGKDLAVLVPPAGPGVALRANNREGFPGAVPFIAVADVAATLAQLVAAGATVEHEPWSLPVIGALARFTDTSGTIWGLTSGLGKPAPPHVPMPFGANPRPRPRTICSLEMHATDGAAAAAFFGAHFGWGAMETMPQFVAFDTGAGIGGVFQSHTPALPAVPYVYVEDVNAALGEIESLGGQRVGEPMAMPGMATFGYAKDPSGTTLGLIGP